MNTDSSTFGNPPQKTVRLACIGLGYIFRQVHAKALSLLQTRGWPVEVAMVCDREQTALDTARQYFPFTKTTQNPDDILGSCEEVDALLICLWPPLGLKVLHQAIDRGFKNILIEKPVSHHATDIQSVAEMASRAGVRVDVAYNRRHHPALSSFSDAIHQLNPLESVTATLLRVDRKEPIFYQDVTPHPLSVLHHILGDITVKNVAFGKPKNDIPESLEASLQSTSGVQVLLKIRPSSGEELELYAAKSASQYLVLPFLPSKSPAGAGWDCIQAGVSEFHGIPNPKGLDEALTSIWRMGYLSQMADFFRTEPSPHACSLQQAASILHISETIWNWPR